MPEAVLAGLARRRVPPELAAFLADGTARAGPCGTRPVPRRGLGTGEAEAICIAGERGSRTFRGYVILADDRAAQAGARSLGMSSPETIGLLERANRAGLATAGEAMAAPGALEASGHVVDAAARADFVRRLV